MPALHQSLIAALTLALASAGNCRAEEPDAAQWAAGLRDNGWTFADANEKTALYRRAGGKSSAGNPQRWVRMEYRDPIAAGGSPTLSAVVLFEYDCAAKRSRVLHVTPYTEHNLNGPLTSTEGPFGWEYVVPGTFAGNFLKDACPAQP